MISWSKVSYVAAAIIILSALLLRFYKIEYIFSFGWDQARDAQAVWGLLHGHLPLVGPKTGIGNFHLGPLYFYLLAPFFLFTHFDPIASQYLNIVINLATFIVIYLITKKLFSNSLALLTILIYGFNDYMVGQNRIPWNVSLIPILSFLIFYATVKTLTLRSYKWSAILFFLCGLFWEAHFTAVIFPIMLSLLWLFNGNKKRLLFLFLASLPFYFICLIPNFIDNFASKSTFYLAKDFFHYYFVGFHLQFLLYRLPDVLLQYSNLLAIPSFLPIKIILPLSMIIFLFTKNRLYAKIILCWLISILIIFGIYGGPISDYYFLPTLPVVLYSFLILVNYLFKIKPKFIPIALLLIFTCFYGYKNLGILHRPSTGLIDQEKAAKQRATAFPIIPFQEGSLESYLYKLYSLK